jgi:hypothetical protein
LASKGDTIIVADDTDYAVFLMLSLKEIAVLDGKRNIVFARPDCKGG